MWHGGKKVCGGKKVQQKLSIVLPFSLFYPTEPCRVAVFQCYEYVIDLIYKL